MYAMRYPRRMVLKNLLIEQWLIKISLISFSEPLKFLKFLQFGRFFANVEGRGNEVDYICIYVKT